MRAICLVDRFDGRWGDMEIRLSAKGLDLQVDKARIPAGGRSVPALVLTPKSPRSDAPGVLWIHGGGYLTGMKEMVFMSRAVDLVTRFGAVVVSPDYRLSWRAPYPAALEDCYASLLWLRDNAGWLGVNASQLMVGGESAGGGLCAAVCLLWHVRVSTACPPSASTWPPVATAMQPLLP